MALSLSIYFYQVKLLGAAMEGGSPASPPSDASYPEAGSMGGASKFLVNLPSRGFFSSTVLSSNPVFLIPQNPRLFIYLFIQLVDPALSWFVLFLQANAVDSATLCYLNVMFRAYGKLRTLWISYSVNSKEVDVFLMQLKRMILLSWMYPLWKSILFHIFAWSVVDSAYELKWK